MRTLYLSTGNGLTVKADGPSLWIEERGRAGRRVPIRLVERVIVSGNVMMESAVITLLADNSIPISFITGRGRVVISTTPMERSDRALRERIEKLRTTPWGVSRVKDWLRARRSHFRMETLRRFNPSLHDLFSTEGFREDLYRKWLRRAAPSGGVVFNVVKGILHTFIVGRLERLGLDPHAGLVKKEDFGLVKDFLYALTGEVERQVVQFFAGRRRTDHLLTHSGGRPDLTREGMRDVILRFENQKERVLCGIDLLLDDLFTIMRELGI